MTLIMTSAGSLDEAEAALAAGADLVDVTQPHDPAAAPLDLVRATIAALAGRAAVSASAGHLATHPHDVPGTVRALAATGLDYIRIGLAGTRQAAQAAHGLRGGAGGTRLLAVLAARELGEPDWSDLIAEAGFAGVLVDIGEPQGRRLFDQVDLGRVARLAAHGRRLGLLTGIAGAFEPPDVVRLLPLSLDLLALRGAPQPGQGGFGRNDAETIGEIRALIGAQARASVTLLSEHAPVRTREPERAEEEDAGPLDRIHVRDLVLPVSIGAYRAERDRRQRVRFDVTVELRHKVTANDDMREVFSYDLIIDAIRVLVERGHVKLVETLAETIAAEMLGHAQVARVSVKVEKLDAGPATVGVEIVRERAREAATVRQLFAGPPGKADPQAAS